jgi:hypothetical protein
VVHLAISLSPPYLFSVLVNTGEKQKREDPSGSPPTAAQQAKIRSRDRILSMSRGGAGGGEVAATIDVEEEASEGGR